MTRRAERAEANVAICIETSGMIAKEGSPDKVITGISSNNSGAITELSARGWRWLVREDMRLSQGALYKNA